MGSPPPLCPRRFRRSWRSVPVAVTRSLAQTGSSSRELRASSEYCRPRSAPRLSAWSPFLGVAFPLRDLSPWRPCNGFPRPSPFRPRRFSRPRRFTPPLAWWVCFTPLPRPGFALQGVVSLAQPLHLVGVACPLVVGRSALPVVAHRRHTLLPRPQGFDPCESSWSTLRCLAAAPTRYPPGLFLLQVLCLVVVSTPSRALPLVTLVKRPSSGSRHRSSAFRLRARLASLEVADLLEVRGLPSP